ncbi:unnamed protein product, partial [Discosporangium mesarthrocarpum]
LPGPGQYSIENSHLHQKNGPTSSFRSFRSGACFHVPDTPAPGAYETSPPHRDQIDKNGKKLMDPSFRSCSKRDMVFKSPATDIPGPGEYEVQKTAFTVNKDGTQDRNSIPCRNSNGIRFGQPLKRKKKAETPGPGWYTPDQTKSEPRESSSSIFVSTTKRFVDGGTGLPPGPAFYQPELQGKKSFHLNMNKTWM